MNPIAVLGASSLRFFSVTGAFFLFIIRGLSHIARPPIHMKNFWRQCRDIGFFSLPMVGMTALFTGAVLALQSYTGFSRFNAESSIATIVVISITRELGPVLTGLMVAGRVGSAIAAELGAMRVTQQIDALVTLSVHPFKYLVAPRVAAGLVCLPLLVIIADIIGVAGGYLVSVYKLGFSPSAYLKSTFDFLEIADVVSGLAKACAFGGIITLVGCFCGYRADHGASGVGKAVMQSVVQSSVLILACNYIMTEIFFR